MNRVTQDGKTCMTLFFIIRMPCKLIDMDARLDLTYKTLSGKGTNSTNSPSNAKIHRDRRKIIVADESNSGEMFQLLRMYGT